MKYATEYVLEGLRARFAVLEETIVALQDMNYDLRLEAAVKDLEERVADLEDRQSYLESNLATTARPFPT